MEESISNLAPNPQNPKTISKDSFDHLKASMNEFGDLSGLVFNAQTQHLIGGHQRTQVFKQLGVDAIHITWETTETPGPLGDLAYGYVEAANGARFTYRRVMWSPEREKAAVIASFRIHGDVDNQGLAELTYEISQFDNADELLALTGMDDKELAKLASEYGPDEFGEQQPDEIGADPHDDDNRRISATNEQWSTIDEAVEYVKARVPIPSEDRGTKYGSSLYYICRVFLEGIHAAAEQPGSQNTNPPGELTDVPL